MRIGILRIGIGIGLCFCFGVVALVLVASGGGTVGAFVSLFAVLSVPGVPVVPVVSAAPVVSLPVVVVVPLVSLPPGVPDVVLVVPAGLLSFVRLRSQAADSATRPAAAKMVSFFMPATRAKRVPKRARARSRA
jgi:hypothetical protein